MMVRMQARLWPALAVALVAAPVLVAAPAVAATRLSATTPYPGVSHEVWSEPAIPARIHLVVIDLTSAELTLRATREEDRGLTASAFAARTGSQIVVNGDYFAPSGWVPDGLAMGDGVPWSTARDDGLAGVFRFGKVQGRTDALVIAPEAVVAPGDLPAFTTGVIGGRPMLLRAGQASATFDCGDGDVLACVRAPRTALGLADDNRRLVLVVVDGWQAGSTGMTAAELAGFLRERGVRDALLLDGGGASTLVVAGEGGVVNRPSDGVERPVANHLGVGYGAQAPGTLLGKVREGSLTGLAIAGVEVALDDGRAITTDSADSGYSFNVAPRQACVTATRVGFNPVTQCKQVEAGVLNFNSLVLHRTGTGVDAGVPDAAIPEDAADPTGDAGAGSGDGGVGTDGGDGGGGGGCCASGSGNPTGLALGALAVVCGLLPRRRRRRP